MKFHKQESLYDPKKGSRGSCYPTVLACLMDLPINEVPNFHLFYYNEKEKANLLRYYNGNYDEANYEDSLWYRVMTSFLASRGFKISQLDKYNLPKNTPYMVTGISSRGVNHIVIYENGKMIHDPHPSNEGVIEGDSLIYEMLIPL